MRELPPTWAQAQLSSITVDAAQRMPLAEEVIRYIDIGSVNRNTKSIESPQELLGKDAPSRARKQVAVGDTLVSMTRPNLNAVALVPKDLDGQIASTGFDVLRPVAGIDPRWIGYLVRTEAFVDAMSALVQGALYPAVRSKDVRAHVVPLAPQAEQTRIANQLDTLLTRIQACNDRFDAIPVLLKRFRQTVLTAATSGRLTEEWRTRRLSNLGAKESGLQTVQSVQQWKAKWLDQNLMHNESSRVRRRLSAYTPPKINPDDVALPEEWTNSPLEDAVLMVVDCHNKTAPYCESGIPLVRTSNIRDGKIVWNDLRYVDEQTYAFWSKRCPPSSGDLIFTREAPIGEVAIVPPDMKLCLGQRTMLLRPVEHLISARYVQICLMAPAFRKNSEVRAVGSGVKHYRVGDVSELEIPIQGFSEQAEIVRRVEALFTLADRIEARCTAARTQAQRLTPLVLAKAFRGELVPQDPNDEPASVLLTRIASSNTAVAGKISRKCL